MFLRCPGLFPSIRPPVVREAQKNDVDDEFNTCSQQRELLCCGCIASHYYYSIFSVTDEEEGAAHKRKGIGRRGVLDEDEAVVSRTSDTNTNWGISDAPYKMVLVINKSLKMGKGKL
jgi:hypothetical protein